MADASGPELLDVHAHFVTDEYVAAAIAEHPARFSYFATLPLPDVEAAVREAIRTTDSGAAGIIVMSNASGQYLGDAALNPLWEHLNASPSDTLVAVRVAAHRGEHSVDPIPRTPFRFRRGPTTTRVRT